MKIEDIKEAIKEQQEFSKDYEDNRRVVSAANLMADGTIVMGIRHCCPQMILQAKMMGYSADDLAISGQGFVDNYNNYISRLEAFKIALRKGQLLEPHQQGTLKNLYSEDLY